MTSQSEDWPRIKRTFEAVRLLPPAARSAYLDEACGSDAALRREVESLLRSHDSAPAFLETPAAQRFAGLGLDSALEGRRIGAYEIGARIGSGGMGDVYKAVDTRLGRTVAVKVMSARVPDGSSSRERFEREARAVAALNHPNICTLHDVGSQDGFDFLVMEYLDGETLAERLVRGPLPIDQALRVASQVAAALDRAHRAGIVHRDLKPGNIMLTKAGAKLLDFGVAKTRAAGSASGPSSSDLTAPGIVLGTARYMAPEQISGNEADARSDLFALGAVLYEMVTARKAFDGPSDAAIAAALLTAQPQSVLAVDPTLPKAIDYVIARCLAKDPDDRWQTARDLQAELQRTLDALVTPDATAPRAAVPGGPSGFAWSRLAWLGLAAVALAAVAVAAVLWTRAAPPQPVRWLSILPPPDGFDLSPDPIVSPDGRYVAFKAQSASHRTSIWLKPLDAPTATPIPGTEGTDYTGSAFWSPDSRSIGFFAQGKLKRIDIDGGAPQTLAAAPEPRGGTWSPAGVILFNADTRNLMRVPASGGAVTRVSEAAGVRLFPHALPDGRHYLFTSRNVNEQGQGVYVGSLEAADVKRVSDAWSPAVYASGHLLFVRERALFAQPFDMGRLEVSGEPVQIADGIGLGYGTPLTYPFSASETGVASFWGGSSAPVTQLTWFTRNGDVLRRVSEPAAHSGLSLSRDGRRAVLDRLDPATSTNDVWLLDPESGGGSSRFTTDGRFSSPVMSPDGVRLALMERGRGIVAMPIGIGDARAVVSGASSKWPSHWSFDGRLLAFTDSTPQGWRLWTVPVGSPDQATLYREAPFALAGLQFSPDGRWVTYMSDETGQFEVYVDSFPTPDHRIRVSPAGGGWPKWRLDGQELFYLAPDRQLMAAAITREGTTVTFSPPQALFEGPGVKPDTSRAQFEPSADGSKFLFNARVELSRSVGLTVITNWPALGRR